MPHLFRPSTPQNRYYAWFLALHTRVDMLLLAPLTESEFQKVEEAIRAELSAVERMGNRFNMESELSQAVAAAAVRPVSLSPELFSLLARCLQAHRETGGLFDITVKSPDFTPGLINAVQLTPFPDVPGGTLSFLRTNLPPMTQGVPTRQGGSSSIILDLSGILKGYALERLRVLLPSHGITDALINLGNSSILSLGANPSDIPSGHCLTTSGNATADRCHIRNPLTGEFITGQRHVSVITPNGIDGEILSITRFL